MLTMKNSPPTDTVCFHAQQCAEKHLKALLAFHSVPFPKIHDIRELVMLVPPRLRPRLDGSMQDRLTKYATVTRYPGGGAEPSLTEARKAVAAARSVRRQVRRLLPRAALWRGKKTDD